jgi:hypothetical protein
MEFVIPTPFRRALLSGACALLLAGCGGDEDGQAVAKSAAPAPAAAVAADSAGPAFAGPPAPPALSADSAAPQQAAAPAPTPATRGARDSAMAEALKAPVTGPVNVQVLANYRLTMDGMRKLVRAGQNLGELQARRPELRDSMRLEAFDPNGIYEKLNSIPDVRDAIGKAGLTPREYATATAALMQAAVARQLRAQGRPMPPQVNEANVRFVEEHWAEIQQMMQAAAAQARPRS